LISERSSGVAGVQEFRQMYLSLFAILLSALL